MPARLSARPARAARAMSAVIQPDGGADMETVHEGGCLCGAIRYKTRGEPLTVNVCHCTFCQRFTGTAFLVEPIFDKSAVEFSGVAPRTYDHRSDSTGLRVTLHFCGTCGTTLYLEVERNLAIRALCGGTFDDPNWFERRQGAYQHIFTRSAQDGVVLPANVDLYEAHRITLDGKPNQPVLHSHPLLVSRRAGTARAAAGD
jgi:hypothetical protein